MSVADASRGDYYAVLGVTNNASLDAIRTAFYQQALRHHPDRGGGDTRFNEVKQAYDVLVDPVQRQLYDQQGAGAVDRLRRWQSSSDVRDATMLRMQELRDAFRSGSDREAEIRRSLRLQRHSADGAFGAGAGAGAGAGGAFMASFSRTTTMVSGANGDRGLATTTTTTATATAMSSRGCSVSSLYTLQQQQQQAQQQEQQQAQQEEQQAQQQHRSTPSHSQQRQRQRQRQHQQQQPTSVLEQLLSQHLGQLYDVGQQCVDDGEDVDGGDGGDGGQLPRCFDESDVELDITMPVTISLLESATGCVRQVEFQRNDACQACNGSGFVNVASDARCPQCDGAGGVRGVGGAAAGRAATTVARDCATCGGSGVVQCVEACDGCGGQGVVSSTQTIVVELPPGTASNMGKRYRNAGHTMPGDVSRKGNFVAMVAIEEHPVLQRHGVDAHCEVPLSIVESMLGRVPSLYEELFVDVPAGTLSGEQMRLAQQGFVDLASTSGQRGDLVLTFLVEMPRELSERQRELLFALALTPSARRSAFDAFVASSCSNGSNGSSSAGAAASSSAPSGSSDVS